MGVFDSIFSGDVQPFTPTQFFLCLLCAIFIGLLVCLFSTYRSEYSKSYLTTIALLPIVVSVVVITVNDNIGMGLAIAGAFSLMKFRSIPGKSREMLFLCIALAAGLLNGTGYLGYAIIFAIASGATIIAYLKFRLGVPESEHRRLKITVSEDLRYSHAFDEVLRRHTSEFTLVKTSTANMGSVFVVTFDIVLLEESTEKALISEILPINQGMDVSIKEVPEDESEL